MALFSETQASGSYITRSKKLFHDNVLQYWTFNVSGSDGHDHVLTVDTLSTSASLQEQKDAIMAVMTSSIEYIVLNEPTVSSSFDMTYNDEAINIG